MSLAAVTVLIQETQVVSEGRDKQHISSFRLKDLLLTTQLSEFMFICWSGNNEPAAISVYHTGRKMTVIHSGWVGE